MQPVIVCSVIEGLTTVSRPPPGGALHREQTGGNVSGSHVY